MSIRPHRVVCIDAAPHARYARWQVCSYDLDGLTEGAIYTVVGKYELLGVPSYELAEIFRPQPPEATITNPGFAAARFRRLLEVSDFMPVSERGRAPA